MNSLPAQHEARLHIGTKSAPPASPNALLSAKG